MSEIDAKINQLQARLDKMVEYQNYFYLEINQIRDEIGFLKANRQSAASPQPAPKKKVEEFVPPPSSSTTTKVFPRAQSAPTANQIAQPNPEIFQDSPKAAQKSSLEEFVGRNLISFIGIIITILGVGIGAKYAIDRDLISPAMRIILGYLFAGGLFGISIWLKNKYLNFSAVLMSGALAIAYFLTFFAYSFYDLIPQKIAFLIMLFVTAFTVIAAISYNRQVIAHIGLVGAYAVPFLLSNNSGRADILFSYMTIINFGILAISVKKFWKPLFYSSFVFTWLIYAVWFLSSYRSDAHFPVALGFGFVFFLTFYLTFLSYKLLAKEEFNAEIVILVLINSFIFYGFGYAIFNSRDGFDNYLGLFTLFNALINAAFAAVIYKYDLGDKKNLYLAIALATTFITIAVPVQFRGNWVTLLWTAEMVVLFCIGRTKRLALYENLSYALMFLASISLLNDWQNAFFSENILLPIFNESFLTSILFAAAFGFVCFVNRLEKYKSADEKLDNLINFVLPTIFLMALYNAFRIEIGNLFHAQIINTAVETLSENNFGEKILRKDNNLYSFNVIWQINYSMLFLTLLSFANIWKIKNAILGFVNFALNCLPLFAFLTVELYLLGELRADYLLQTDAEIFPRGIFNIILRYISYGFAAALILASYEYVKQKFLSEKFPLINFNLVFDLVFHLTLLWIASSELVNWMNIFGFDNSYKLGLSILWGLYSLLLIILGIVQRKKHLRISAIGLFAVTLIKLFFYDISELDTISKTVVFVSLGILLLIISFLYNKYKDIIFNDDQI